MLPDKLLLEVVTPEGLLLREEVDTVVAPGELGYFGVLPGHRPFFSALGVGEISYTAGKQTHHMTCFWGFCEVLPDRVSILAELGERAEDIDVGRAEADRQRASERLKALRDEAGFKEAQATYMKAVTRLSVARKRREA